MALGRIELAKSLLKQGAPIEKVVINHVSLFEFALLAGHKKFYEMLQGEVQQGQTVHNEKSAVLPLLISSFIDDQHLIEKIERAIDQGANINAKTGAGDTALISAGWNGDDLGLVQYLVEHGADMNVPNNNGDTPLMDAAYLGKINILRYLLTSGADLTLRNGREKTALDLARDRENKEAEDLLLQYMDNSNPD